MKTNYTFQQKTLRFLSLFVGAITVTACGSYQNSSYYDNDGVYGPDKTVTYERPTTQDENVVVVEQTNKYTQQFKDMEGDFEVLTDVDNYSSTPDTVYVQENSSRYAGWGENQTSNITVNYYDNWGWNRPFYGGYYGNGWNNWGWNGWYGNNWGWNGNSWGWNNWGWNGWYGGYYGPYWGNGFYGGYYGGYYGNGWYNGYYGGRNVAYHNGPRGGYVNRNGNAGRYSSERSRNTIGTPRNQTSQPRGNAIGTPRTISTPRTNTNVGTPRSQTTTPRVIVTQPRTNTNTGTPRNQGSGPKIYTPRNDSPRSDSPRSISTPRSSDFGGGRSSGGGGSMGGGRSSGGGGGRGGRG